jgi:hypothetical protein
MPSFSSSTFALLIFFCFSLPTYLQYILFRYIHHHQSSSTMLKRTLSSSGSKDLPARRRGRYLPARKSDGDSFHLPPQRLPVSTSTYDKGSDNEASTTASHAEAMIRPSSPAWPSSDEDEELGSKKKASRFSSCGAYIV